MLLLALGASDAAGQAGLLVPTASGRPDPDVLALREMTIEAGIARAYARVNVRQVFENRTGNAQEGTYRFRLPPSAAIGDFAVWDGLVRIPGTILERRRARALYRALTTERVDPGLLQQGDEEGDEGGPGPRPSGGAAFAVTVAPIPPWATKRLELQFQQEVPFVGGRAELRLGLRPPDGEPPVAGSLRVRIRVEGARVLPTPEALPLLKKDGRDLVFEGQAVRLDRDLVVRLEAEDTAPLRLSAFRNPDGRLPDGLALAPWERPSEIPPEPDGFFLLEATPPAAAEPPRGERPPRPPVTLGIAFDTSLSVRFAALETAYGHLVRVLRALSPADRFTLAPFDRQVSPSDLRPGSAESIEAALAALRSRPLGPGSDVAAALRETRALVGATGRLLLLTDGPTAVGSRALADARGPLPLFTVLTGEELPEAYRAASRDVLGPGVADAEADLFFARLLGPFEEAAPARAPGAEPPFRVAGAEPQLRDVYPVLVQPPSPASLSGWIGRYAVPQSGLRWEVAPELLGTAASLDAPLPERALEARDLPRRWARARVDHLLMRIEAEGERREWIDEIVELSRRFKFVTPYTAFLAAPRALLRPRRIQPGDPVLRVECDAGTVSAVALFPFGRRLTLQRRPGTRLWEGRFLVPEGLADGRYAVRVLLRDRGGAHVSESKTFVLDGRAPKVVPETPPAVRAGDSVRIAARTDEDVILLSARLGEGAPVPLRWDPAALRSVGTMVVPASISGRQELLFEAVDGARNHGFARAEIEVRP